MDFMEKDQTKTLKKRINDLEKERVQMTEEISFLLNNISEWKNKTGKLLIFQV